MLGAVALAAASGCGHQAKATPQLVHGIKLVPMPAPALERCRAGKRVGHACPTLIPSARWRSRPEWSNERGDFPGPGAFELSAGAEHPEPSLDRPPRFVHLLILGGE